MITFLKTAGTPLQGTTNSSSPSFAKPASSLPVLAFSAASFVPVVNRIRGGLVSSPGQYATPRDVAPPVPTGYFQISWPVSASSATTLLPEGKYILPFTTMGVASDPGAPNAYVHAGASWATFAVLICVSWE